jgi:amino acid transporter
MSEETRKAKSAVPRAMFWSIFMNGVLGFIMVNVLLASMGSVADALDSASPILTILLNTTESTGATTAMITGLFGMNVLFPGEGSHEAFWIVLALMAAVLTGMIGFFRYKRWL